MAPGGIDQALDRIATQLDRIEGKVDDVDQRVRDLEMVRARQEGAVHAATVGGQALWTVGAVVVSAIIGTAAWAVPKLMDRAAPQPVIQQPKPLGPAAL